MNAKDFQEKIYQSHQKRWAALFDPDKHDDDSTKIWAEKINLLHPDLVLYGGTVVEEFHFHHLLPVLKSLIHCPIVIFPGQPHQISVQADGLLLLSLLSGRNPDYLIGHQVKTARQIEQEHIQVASTAYLLLDGGSETSAMAATQTQPMGYDSDRLIFDTCLAAKQMGFQNIYLEAGSGAKNPIPSSIIQTVKQETQLNLWIGGGIRTVQQREQAWQAGADWVVMGNVFEEQ